MLAGQLRDQLQHGLAGGLRQRALPAAALAGGDELAIGGGDVQLVSVALHGERPLRDGCPQEEGQLRADREVGSR